MRVAYLGNFEPSHSTENEVRKAMGVLGWEVYPGQENDPDAWGHIAANVSAFDLILWTSTRDLRPDESVQRRLLSVAESAGVPTVFYHLDRWWGLRRERELRDVEWTRCTRVCTADGGHDDRWQAAGVEHRWYPPAVSEFECVPGTPRDDFRSEIAFVGSWDGYGHPEAWHRPALVQWLRDNYGDRVAFWPKRGEHALRGEDLRDLVASTTLFVGDSCILSAEEAQERGTYWSDRCPELTGRGGILAHPWTLGLDAAFPDHIAFWDMGDWDALRMLIDGFFADEFGGDPDWVQAFREMNRAHVLKTATYTVRMEALQAMLTTEGLL